MSKVVGYLYVIAGNPDGAHTQKKKESVRAELLIISSVQSGREGPPDVLPSSSIRRNATPGREFMPTTYLSGNQPRSVQ